MERGSLPSHSHVTLEPALMVVLRDAPLRHRSHDPSAAKGRVEEGERRGREGVGMGSSDDGK